MAATTSPPPEDRMNKRMKPEDGQPAPPMETPPGRYPPPHYRGGPPMPQGYYGGPPPYPPGPPPHWQGGPPPHYRGPERGGGAWNGGYRSSSPKRSKHHPKIDPPPEAEDPYYPHGPPPHYSRGAPPPPGYGGAPYPGYASQSTWTGETPPRHDGYPRHDMDMQTYNVSRGPGSVDDDGAGSSSGSTKEKGRGSYKCGRCGVPKKGHVCPYQPKVKRRPDEPPPQTRNAAVQVEMDEFMTLRRLNIRIQGFPESYATEPYGGEPMVVGEPRGPSLPDTPEMDTTETI